MQTIVLKLNRTRHLGFWVVSMFYPDPNLGVQLYPGLDPYPNGYVSAKISSHIQHAVRPI